ncbi:uncharacterized protein BCR38DRAFT_406678 [Pseudomassariella vexata]|uniref:Uncharacterized protein n=1 Tax=Pseudomassariella vexata TaxID=1141098 RepID=A0A1Y2EB44_9PEZI|nr:uncharacterized protein BCR38DRAFT_406678 [Pseudomassariella vexata]ORY68781.1 hypothetical protein BCR38DRAFT_406678 [Pseudomassariella vexata]
MVHTTTTTTTRHGLFGRKKVVHHQKRKATIGDKISGAILKLKGTLTHRPGEKVTIETTLPTPYYPSFPLPLKSRQNSASILFHPRLHVCMTNCDSMADKCTVKI